MPPKVKELPPEAMAYYLQHPVEFVEQQIMRLTPQQVKENKFGARLEKESKEILWNIGKYDYVSIFGGRGISKCRAEDEDILLANGSYVKYRDLVDRNFKILGMKTLWGPLEECDAYATDNGTQECLRITTQFGAVLTVTLNHPLLTFDGWKPSSELQVGDKIAMPSKVTTTPRLDMDEDVLKFLAYMIGDGCSSHRYIARFSQPQNAVLAEMGEIVKGFGCKLVLRKKYDYAISKTDNGPNRAIQILDEYGLRAKKSRDKFIPPDVFAIPLEKQRIFLNRLFATDGTVVTQKNIIHIGYSSTSYNLILGVKRLLLRFGIVSNIKNINTSWTHKGVKKVGTAYVLYITDYEFVIKFCDEIGIYGRDDEISICRKRAEEKKKNACFQTTGCSVWPQAAYKYLLDYRDRNGILKQDFRHKAGVRNRAARYGKTVKEYTIKKFLKHYDDQKLQTIIDNGVKWDAIASIEPVGKKPTVTVTVPGAENYVCDIFEHNSFSLSQAILWFLFTRSDARVMATGPKFDQLKATLWAEVNKWLQKSNLTDEIKWSSERIYHVDPKANSFGQIMTSKDRENIAGIHATHVMWIIDEASNVDQEIIDAILGGMNDPENKIVMAGNPTRASGAFFDTHNKDRDQWRCLRYSSDESERVNKVWLNKMQRFPRESDMYRVYVLGLPPLGNPKSVISLADCQAARDRTIAGSGNTLEMGLDPAREGNDLTAIAIRRGLKLLEVRTFAKTKGPEVIGHTLKMLREYRSKTGYKGIVRIKVDDHGIGGPIADELALNETDNIDVVPCLFGGKGDDKYADPATIMWFELAELINDIELCDDEDLLEELSTREWNPASGGKMQVEAKAKYKDRLGRSPDKADATILCYSTGPKKVFARSDTDEPVARKFDVDWQNENLTNSGFEGVCMVEVLHYAALVLNSDLSFSGIAAVYQHYMDTLWIYDEFYQERPEPDVIAQVVKMRTKFGLYSDDRNVRVIGNERMFRKEGDRRPLADVFMQIGLSVKEPVRYDEYGAIALGSKMFANNKIIMHTCIEKARTDINLWSIKKGKPDADESGFCKALLLILSEVRRQRKSLEPDKKIPDYHPIRQPITEQKPSMTAWCKR